MRALTAQDLDPIALGATLLGSGGGGAPQYELMMTRAQFEQTGPAQVIDVEEVPDGALVVPLGYVGAPLVGKEKLPTMREAAVALGCIENFFGQRPFCLIAGEIGGANAFYPILYASRLGLPVVDGDLLGRAFPEVQMSTVRFLENFVPHCFAVDIWGGCTHFTGENCSQIEEKIRAFSIAQGSSCFAAIYPMRGRELKQIAVRKTLTQAQFLGNTLREGKKPIDALVNNCQAIHFGEGVVTDIQQEIEGGFLKGSVTIAGENRYKIYYQNEFLVLMKGESPLAATPSILCLIEQQTGVPITTETIRYGQRLEVIGLPAPEIWTTQKGLEIVGPEYFGYKITRQLNAV